MLQNYWKFPNRNVQTFGFVGKAIWENPIETWMGENSKLGMSLCSSWKRIILICVCGWHQIGWKETQHSSDVETTKQRSWYGRINIFLRSCAPGLYLKTMWNKQRYCWQLQNHVLWHPSHMCLQTIVSWEKHCQTMQIGTVSRLRFCRRFWGFKIYIKAEFCAFFGSRTFVPIIWMCKKQTSVSRDSTESEIISLDAGLRLDGIPALDLWDLVVAILHGNTHQSNQERWDPCTNLVRARLTNFQRERNLTEWLMI